MSLPLRVAVEALATAFLLAAVVGSGIMGERLADGNVAIALLANSLATAGALIALIVAAGPVSGAHMNPAVTLLAAIQSALPWRDALWYVPAQCAGAVAGVLAAHAMYDLPIVEVSEKVRAGVPLVWSEFVATLGLLLLVTRLARANSGAGPYAVAAYILAAYWFTASTSFANPAVTLARCLTDTFAGIRPADAPGFIAAQLGAVGVVALVAKFLGGAQRAPANESAPLQRPPADIPAGAVLEADLTKSA
jgi:glycerol uptake facilitator-like aquaporin